MRFPVRTKFAKFAAGSSTGGSSMPSSWSRASAPNYIPIAW